jgi:hypothetical protein
MRTRLSLILLVAMIALCSCSAKRPVSAPVPVLYRVVWAFQIAPDVAEFSVLYGSGECTTWENAERWAEFDNKQWSSYHFSVESCSCAKSHYPLLTGDAEVLDRLGFCGPNRGVYVIGETRCYANDARPKFWDAKDLRCY